MAAKEQPKRSPYQAPPPPQWPAWAALGGVGVALVLSLSAWSQQRKATETIEGRFQNLEASVQQLTTKVDQAQRAAAPRRTGPDPDKIHPVKIAGAPSKGRMGAPIVIAEFSDFQ